MKPPQQKRTPAVVMRSNNAGRWATLTTRGIWEGRDSSLCSLCFSLLGLLLSGLSMAATPFGAIK
jgi:hypothetical protein